MFKVRLFAAYPKLPSKLCCHAHFNVCICALLQSKFVVNNVGMLLAAFVLFLSPAMLNLDRNSNRNNTSTRYKAIIKFWRLSIANQGKSNIDKNMCETSSLCSFLASKVVFQPSSQPYSVYSYNAN